MKGFKKLLTGILAATMIMGASLTAFAADDASITITNENNNDGAISEITYTYYQILKADVKNVSNDGPEQSGTAAYYVETKALADLLTNTGLFNVEKSATENRWNVTAIDGVTGTQIVEKLNTVDFKNAASARGTFSNKTGDKVSDSATVTGLNPGYYLVLSSLGTTAAVQTLGDVTINEKNTYPTVEKEENKDVDSMYDDAAPVIYTINVTVPSSVAEENIIVYDVATKGLTLNKEVKATVGDKEIATYTWGDGVATNGKFTYSLTIPAATVIANAGKTIKLTYSATINKDAVVLVPEENSAYIEYGNYTSAETDPVKVVTLGIDLLKVDGVTKAPISGAEFTLWTAPNNGEQIHVVFDENANAYRKASAAEIAAMTDATGKVTSANIAVDENGKAQIIGLDATTYYLQEEVAPTGYNKLTSRKTVVISKTTELEKITIENNSGSVLPSTGGIGTTIFYIFGSVLILAGVAYFMVRRKADAE